MTTALLLVDIQNDHVASTPRAVPGGAEVVAVANRLMPLYPLVFATRISDGAGAELADGLERSPIVRVFDRSRQLAGADFADLVPALREAAVDELVILGLPTELGVLEAARWSRQLGLRTFVVEDGCRGYAVEAERAALDAMDRAGVQLVASRILALPREILTESTYLRMVQRGHWQFVERTHPRGAVVILAITDDGKVLLTDQWRIPVGRRVIELPAGIVGDEPGLSHEPMVEAARRELLEETGYEAAEWAEVFHAVSSAGLSNECATFFLARGLRKVAPGGGDANESIRVHEIPVEQLDAWIAERFAAGYHVDARICAALYLWRQRGW